MYRKKEKLKTFVSFLLILTIWSFLIFPNQPPVKAKELLIAEPMNFVGNWNGSANVLTHDLNENSDFNKFDLNNSATPITWLEQNTNSNQKNIVVSPIAPIIETPSGTNETSEIIITPEPVSTTPSESSPTEPPIAPTTQTAPTENQTTTSFLWNFSHKLMSFLFSPVQAKNDDKIQDNKNNNQDIINPATTTTSSTLISTTTIISQPTSQNNQQISLTLSKFIFTKDTSYFDKNIQLTNTKLALSLANHKLSGDSILIEYKNNDVWAKLTDIALDQERLDSNHIVYLPLTEIDNWPTLKNLEIKITYQTNSISGQNNVFLDAIWLETEHNPKEGNDLADDESSVISLTSKQTSFAPGEHPHFDFSISLPSSTPSLLEKIKNIINNFLNLPVNQNTDNLSIKAAIFSPLGEEMQTFEPKISAVENNKFSIDFPTDEYKLKPGTYKIKIDFFDNQNFFTYEQNFTLGVLTINSNKSFYLPGETAYLQMAALQPDGHTICDANLQLIITNPDNQITTTTIKKSGECGPDNVVSTPDYYSYYQTSGIGKYKMTLTNLDNGNLNNDSFEVDNIQPLIVERVGPTRIFPPAPYQMIIKLKATKNLTGFIEEKIPVDFNIIDIKLKQISPTNKSVSTTPTISTTGSIKRISWPIHWKENEEYVLEYLFKAPDLSPFIYSLGKLNFVGKADKQKEIFDNTTSTDKIFFEESRNWKIAADAVDFIDPNIDGTVGCAVASPNANHYQNVNDGLRQPATTNATSSYNACLENQTDFFGFTTLTNVTTTSAIEAWVYHQDGNENMQWEISLWDDSEVTQYGTSTLQLANSTSTTWGSVNFTGLSLTPANLDGLKIKYKNVKTGAGATATSTVYALYGSITYTPANPAPTVGTVTLNSGNNITLTESTTTVVTVTTTVTDLSGYADITNVTGKIYRSGVTSTYNCTLDNNNCYQNTNCPLSNCSGNTCDATCSFNVQYFADPTDSNTPWSSEYWRAWIQGKDSLNQTNTNLSASNAPDLSSLLSFKVSPTIGYGTLDPGGSETYLSHATTVTSTGNCSMNLTLYGTAMANGSDAIPVAQQKFSIINATNTLYASGTILTADPGQTVSTSIPKITATSSSNNTTNIWWGISVPTGLPQGSYVGTTTFIGIQNSLPWP